MKKAIALVLLTLGGCSIPVSVSDMQLAASFCETHSGVDTVAKRFRGDLYIICKNGLQIIVVQSATVR